MNAFLLQDMFPITEDYIAAEYKINGNPMMLTSDREAAIVLKKAQRTLNMIHRGMRFTPTSPDVLKIEAAIIAKQGL